MYDKKDSVKQMGEILHASVQCYRNTEKKLSNLKIGSSPEKSKDGDGESSAGEGIHFALDCMGMIPGIGAVFDGINACWYACEGRWGEVLLSGLALIPAVGLLAGAGKVGTKAGIKIISHTDDFTDVAKGLGKLDDVSDAAKGLDKLEDASDIVKYGDDLLEGASGTGLDKKLMNELAESGVKYNVDDVVMITKKSDGKLLWLERGNGSAGLKHIVDGHAANFANKGITDIPGFLNKALQSTPINTGTSANGAFADYLINGSTYRVAYGSNGFIVSFYPIK